MTYNTLDTIVLTRDIPELALHTGDLGVIVLLHSTEMVEVEFSTPDGAPPMVTAVPTNALRLAHASDMLRLTPQG